MVKKETNVGRAVSDSLSSNSQTQSYLASATGLSAPYINQVVTGQKKANARWIDLVADAMDLSTKERQKLHIAAALDHGFKVGLSKP